MRSPLTSRIDRRWIIASAVVACAQAFAFIAFYFSVWILKFIPEWLLWGAVAILFLPGGLLLLPMAGTGFAHLGLWFFAVAAALSWIIYTIALRLTLSRTHSGNKQAAQVLPAEVQPMSHSRRRFSPRLRVLVTVIIITSMVSFMFIEKLVFHTRSGLLVDVLAVLIILAVIWIVAPRSS
jgi:hypothetical protein